MIKLGLIAFGILFTIVVSFITRVSIQFQEYILFSGILLLGIPHGAADQLVSQQTSLNKGRDFSKARFFSEYMGRLLLFGLLLYFFPLTANALFLLFSAYHFGETDINEYRSDRVTQKLMALADGTLVIAVILLTHLDEVKPIYLFSHAVDHSLINTEWFKNIQVILISVAGIAFCTLLITHHLSVRTSQRYFVLYMMQLLALLFIISQLPLLLAFAFYFVAWHSVLSIHHIITYLKEGCLFSTGSIIWQLVKNTLIVYTAISFLAVLSYLLFQESDLSGFLFVALAMLTAPHLPVMQQMYMATSINKGVMPN